MRALLVLVMVGSACKLQKPGSDGGGVPGDTGAAAGTGGAAGSGGAAGAADGAAGRGGSISPDARSGGGGGGGALEWDPAKYPWPMFGHDARRTGRSPFNGPSTDTAASPRNWQYLAAAQASIDMQPVVTDAGVFFGGWGVNRQMPGAAPHAWTKYDGGWLGLHLERKGSDGAQQLWPPFDPTPPPACYLKAGRPRTMPDTASCGAGNDYHLSWFNGTIEGTPVIDPATGVQYFGRGDGALYAVDPAKGSLLWRYMTFNPEDPTDPEGGGEIPGGPLLGPGKILYFATWGLPWPAEPPNKPSYETHAVYAVDLTGKLVWRYPSATARLENGILASPALSPDGRTLYVGTWFSGGNQAGRLLALDLTAPANAPDSARLRWALELKHPGRPLHPQAWTRHISVGADGTIFLGGFQTGNLGTPIVTAIKDRGPSGEITWWVEPQGHPSTTGQLVVGLALWEEGGVTTRVVASTSHLRDLNALGGALFWLDAKTGATLGSFDPATTPGGGLGSMSPPILGNDGTVYAGVRGRHDLFAAPDAATSQWRNGHMYGVRLDGAAVKVLFDHQVDGLIDWASPAIGANGALYFGSTAKFRDLVEYQMKYAPGVIPKWTSPVFTAIFE